MNVLNLYYAIDDSGKIDDPYAYSVYAGVLFLDAGERSQFIRRYGNLVSSMKCHYCLKHPNSCDRQCPEVKSYRISPAHRRRLVNLIKKKHCFVVIADKQRITRINLKDKKTKRRFLDYSLKLVVKSTLKQLIRAGALRPEEDLCLNIHIDNENRASDGIYSFEESIRKELHEGMRQNNMFFRPLITGALVVRIRYQDSRKNYDVQGADILAGTLRRYLIHSSSLSEAMAKIAGIADVAEIVPYSAVHRLE